MTAIDWIFEYKKERDRLRRLYSSATGLVGYFQQLLDAGQIWVVLIATGIAAGILAASIDVASDWLADLKTGYCNSGAGGGHFYLNKGFCCWGHDGRSMSRACWQLHLGFIRLLTPLEWSQCQGWTSWSTALHVTSKGGSFIIEYIFFVIYSVCSPYQGLIQDC
jgi:chloride channel 3/4/5